MKGWDVLHLGASESDVQKQVQWAQSLKGLLEGRSFVKDELSDMRRHSVPAALKIAFVTDAPRFLGNRLLVDEHSSPTELHVASQLLFNCD